MAKILDVRPLTAGWCPAHPELYDLLTSASYADFRRAASP